MNYKRIEEIVVDTIKNYCNEHGIDVELTKDSPLMGRTRILDSMGLVNVLVDIETAFLDDDVEVSLTSETAMSSRISPFRSVRSVCNFIAQQLGVEE